MDNFVYIIEDIASQSVAIVDPGWDANFFQNTLKSNHWSLDKIILTHGHFDHVNALDEVLGLFPGTAVYISEKEADALTPDVPNLLKTEDGDSISIGQSSVSILHTPGHSPGGQCLIIGSDIITGDTLFVDACGRADLPGSDKAALFQSLKTLAELPEHYRIYPGHNYGFQPTDTIESQKQRNRYLRATQDEFLSIR